MPLNKLNRLRELYKAAKSDQTLVSQYWRGRIVLN